MSEKENIRNLEKAITEFLIQKEISEFRWIREEERDRDDNFVTCMMIDGDANIYVWEYDGLGEVNRVIEPLGYFMEPINYIDIGVYKLAKCQKL